jgi:hypothetical protein
MKDEKGKFSEIELFDLVDAASYVFWEKEAEGFKRHLKDLLWAHRPVESEIVVKDWVKWFAYVIRLILTCPPLLEKPPGFEWVMGDFERILSFRKFRFDYDRYFWDALDKVRRELRKGRPSRKDKDYERYMSIGYMVKYKGLSKSQAVEQLAVQEALTVIWDGVWSPQIGFLDEAFTQKTLQRLGEKKYDKFLNVQDSKKREIWRSLERVERDQQKLIALLEKYGPKHDNGG